MKNELNNSFSDSDRELFATMRVCIISPMYKPPAPRFMQSAVNAVAYAWINGLRVEDMGVIEETVIHWARNELVRAALPLKSEDGQPFSHFMWMDNDHVFKRDLICQLARHFARPEVDIMSALYFNRNKPYLPVAYVQDTNINPYTHYPLVQVPSCLCEVDAVGFGAVMTKREVFERMEDPWFHMTGRNGEHVGEDMSFCVHAKQAGFRIFLDGQYKLGHFGTQEIVTESVYKKYCEENPDLFGDKIKVQLGGIIVNG